MKKTFNSIGILFIFVLHIYSQDTISDAIKYYPLQIGNYWEYADWMMQQGMSYDTTYYSIEITGDSLLPNGKYYKILKKRILPSNAYAYSVFERIDSVMANVYRYSEDRYVPHNEYLIDSLLSNQFDTCTAMRNRYTEYPLTTCEDVYDGEVLSYNTTIKAFWDQSSIPGLNYKLAKNIGYVGDSQWEGTHWGTDLLYAKINDLEIGTPITSIKMENRIPIEFKLYHAYPNPFNSSTTISFYSEIRQNIEINLFDIQGRFVYKEYSGYCKSGLNEIHLQMNNLSSGLYFCKIMTNNKVFINKLMCIK
jgi:hypothetical protein